MARNHFSKMRAARLGGTCLILVALIPASFAQTASEEMSAGVAAYKSARYGGAIEHFQKAVKLDPRLTEAHLYLATALAQMYIPGADSADNLAIAEQSIAEFNRVLESSPTPRQQIQSLRSLASLNFNMKHFDEARQNYRQVIQIDADDAEPYFSLAVMDWTEAYQSRMELRQSMGLKPTDLLDSSSACALLRSVNQQKVEDGIQNLHKALDIRCDYDDAMAYMNLFYREKAEYECDDPAMRNADLKLADDWVDRTMATKKVKAEKTQPTP
jgi:Tetratricopeptide repeat